MTEDRRDDVPELERRCDPERGGCGQVKPISLFSRTRHGARMAICTASWSRKMSATKRGIGHALLHDSDSGPMTIRPGRSVVLANGVRMTPLEAFPGDAPAAPAPAAPAPAAPAPAAPAFDLATRYTFDEWLSLADSPSVLVADNYALLYLVVDGEPTLYLLEPDVPGHGRPVPPVGTAWINVLGRYIEGSETTPRGRVWFQARESRD